MDDITALVKGRKKEVAEIFKKKKMMKKLKEVVEKKVSSFQSLKMARKERAR